MRSTTRIRWFGVGVIAALAISVAIAQRLRPSDVEKLPSKAADTRIPYGQDERQFGELRLPKGSGPFPLAVVIHGGCWISRFATLQSTAALADALRDAGIATWNIEYRRADHPGGGWPGTFTDVADGTDIVRQIAKQHPIDVSRVVTVGHSAGAHLALWSAGRKRLPKGSPLYREDPLPLRAAIALGGPGDLQEFYGRAKNICGSNVIEQLMGGSPETVPDRYAQGSPVQLLPAGVPQVLIVGEGDGVMPEAARRAYASAARRAGDSVEVVEVPGGHFEVIAPTSEAWPAVRDKVLSIVK
jgi:acetyl esterase/lipase